jgi:hypothetical protein
MFAKLLQAESDKLVYVNPAHVMRLAAKSGVTASHPATLLYLSDGSAIGVAGTPEDVVTQLVHQSS